MNTVTDQAGFLVEIPHSPRRIVSLVPSQTELLYDLGLDEEVVGITKFCVHPDAWYRSKNRVGGTKKVEVERLKGLAPDLVIANKEENTREDIERIREFCPVWTSDVPNVSSALAMISDLASVLKVEEEGRRLKEEIMACLACIVPARKKAAYLIWKKPYMAAGGDTFISSMMEAAGYTNVFSKSRRYPDVTNEDLQALKPDLIMLSSEPYPFKMNDIEELSQFLPNVKIRLVDGEMFSWYGSRMKLFASYVSTELHL